MICVLLYVRYYIVCVDFSLSYPIQLPMNLFCILAYYLFLLVYCNALFSASGGIKVFLSNNVYLLQQISTGCEKNIHQVA